MHIPSPGAVCPAIVKFPSLILRSDFKYIVPETLKITIRGPFCSIAYRKVPGVLESSKELTI